MHCSSCLRLMSSLGRDQLCRRSAAFYSPALERFRQLSFAVGSYRVNACGWVGLIPPCLAGPQSDVLPVVLLLADVEEGLLLAGGKPCHLLGPVFSDPWTSDPPTPHLQLRGTRGGLMSAARCWDRLCWQTHRWLWPPGTAGAGGRPLQLCCPGHAG